MALSDDLRERVVGAVVEGGMSRNAAKPRARSPPAPTGGDRRSGRIEAHRDYLLGLIRRRPDMTLLEMQERLIANCGERFSSSVRWRFFDRQMTTMSPFERVGTRHFSTHSSNEACHVPDRSVGAWTFSM